MRSPFGIPESLKKEGEPTFITVEKFKELCQKDLEMGVGDYQTDIQLDILTPEMANKFAQGNHLTAYLMSLRDLKERLEDLGYLCPDLAMAEFLASRFIDKATYEDKITYPNGSPILDYLNMIEEEKTGLDGMQ